MWKRYQSAVRATVAASAAPYGYTLTVWTSGAVLSHTYEPYGRVFALRAGDVHQPLRFPGQIAEQFDTGANGSTARSYNAFRWYHPTWGRYSQADPLGLLGGANLYSFVRGYARRT